MTTRKVVDLAEVREEREKRIGDFLNTLGDVWIVRIEKTSQPEGLKAKCECILACTYEDLQQNLSDVLDVMIALRSERDAETVDREKRGAGRANLATSSCDTLRHEGSFSESHTPHPDQEGCHRFGP
jgi:hypothetical protein